MVDQAAALGIEHLIDFGLHGDDSAEAYVAMMRAVAPYAARRGLAISMKLHDSLAGPEAILDGQVAIFEAIGHPAFGLCMDPGNIIYYTAASNGFDYRLPTEGLAEVAHCFNTMIVKDCVVDEAGAPNVQHGGAPNPPERDGKPNVMVQPGEGRDNIRLSPQGRGQK